MTDLRFQVLGPVRAWRDEQELDVGGPRQRAVLAALLLHVDGPLTCERVVEFGWGPLASPGAAAVVHTYVRRLRSILDPDRRSWSRGGVVNSSAQGYRLRADPEVIDVWRFRRLVAAARAGGLRVAAGAAYDRLAAALALWAGPALTDVGDNTRLNAVHTALEQERLSAAVLLADAAFTAGRVEESIPELERTVALAPLHEPLHARLMEAYRRLGQRADALRVYGEIRARLREELGMGPGPDLSAGLRLVLQEDRPDGAGHRRPATTGHQCQCPVVA